MQIVTELPETLRLVYPPLFASILHAFRLLMDPLSKVLEIFRIECIEPLELYVRFFVIMALPVICIVLLVLLRLVSDAYASRGQAAADLVARRKADNKAKQDYRVFFMFFLLYPLLSRTVFHIFSCQRVSDSERWHLDDASIDCNSSSHAVMQVCA